MRVTISSLRSCSSVFLTKILSHGTETIANVDSAKVSMFCKQYSQTKTE